MRIRIDYLLPITLAVMSPSLQGQGSNDPSGSWRFQLGAGSERTDYTFVLSLGEDGNVMGMVHRIDGTGWKIEEGKIEGDELSLTVHPEYNGRELTAEFRGQIKGDEIEGTTTVTARNSEVLRTMRWSSKRSVEMKDVVGTWSINIRRNNGDSWNSALTIKREGDQYKGIYTSRGQQHEVTGLGVESNRLTFTTIVTRAGRELTLRFTGRPYGTRIPNGSLDIDGGALDLPFTGTLSPGD